MRNLFLRFAPFCAVALCLQAAAAPATPAKPGKFPDPSLKPDQVIKATPGTNSYTTAKGKYDGGNFAVYIPKEYTAEKPMPLVVSSHGAGGTGPKELGGWLRFADKYGFIVVCPSYDSATSHGSLAALQGVIAQDERHLKDIMERVFKSLNIDRAHVLHTGFSGGGVPTWYIAWAHPEWFTALCFRSANFYGEKAVRFTRKSEWKTRPLYIFWGSNDNPIIVKQSPVMGPGGEGPPALALLKKMQCKQLKHEILEGGGHDSHPDLAAKWFGEEVLATPAR